MTHATLDALEAGVAQVRRAPKDDGAVELIVRRPAEEERETVEEAVLDPVEGLLGDNWRARGSAATEDGSAHPDLQLTLMNTRVAALVARTRERWPLAGDQLFVDLDLSEANLPAGTRLAVGSAVIEVTAIPHTGCGKFARRFGVEALKFVNSPVGRELHMRGRNARVIRGGVVRTGDTVRKLL
ncbi:MAG TPA: MOSC domain-containing protein [Thermoleophilaceae bacterium]|nr:MOSC domain-containing protein [Thermoleophilaceae bacterium]